MQKCAWCLSHPLLETYHDHEWGAPIHDDRQLFEHLVLETAQAGLSWLTVLKKRAAYRSAFANFDAAQVALMTSTQSELLLKDSGIIRHRLKIAATIHNAHAFLAIQAKFGSFNDFIWQHVDGKTLHNQWQHHCDIPSQTPLSVSLSTHLKNNGFKFIGATVCYAYLQAIGIVNDHTVDCFRHLQLLRTPS
ncbi:MAG: DNA-3-methyladenine glycosylase I [Methylococcaceae bacterium]|nr:MAG: DNA-3-methyladenine glycosylase I [Methylococcaceae bacterium]